jgi:hypothetical protein
MNLRPFEATAQLSEHCVEIARSSYKKKRIDICTQREEAVSRTLCKTQLLLIPLIAAIFHGLNYAHLPFAVVRLVAAEAGRNMYILARQRRPRVLQLAGAARCLEKTLTSARLIAVARHVVMLSQVN